MLSSFSRTPRTVHWAAVFLTAGVLFVTSSPAPAQHHGHETTASSSATPSNVLQAPGHSVFGTVQEAIRQLEADSTTDWSQVDIEALRQHLIDMQHVALHVTVQDKTPIEGGVRLRVKATTDAARASLARVLDAHPHMLHQETGWTMEVHEDDASYVLRVTTENPQERDKIRGLGYMGLLAYGQHHQRHHWHLVRGEAPHE